MLRLTRVVALVAALAGCANQDVVEEDGRDDAFTTDGKLDGFQCTPEEAAAILHVVNTASRSTLENDVGLSAKAADNVIAVREGDDEVAGTADDTTFGSLTQLDAVPYIGPVAFAKLLTYVHDADLVGDVPSAGGEWTIATIANGTYPSFALTPDGQPVIVSNTGGWKLRQADGSTVAMPADTAAPYNAPPRVAVAADGTVHIVYRPASSSSSPAAFKHASYRNGQWTQHDPFSTSTVWLDQSPDGTIFALAKDYTCSSCAAPLTLYAIAPDGSKTAEPLWSVNNDTTVSFAVGNDGFPAIVSTRGPRYARRGSAGWRTFEVDPAVASADSIATTGGENATVFAAVSGMRTYRQSGATFSELNQNDFIDYTPPIDAAADGLGTAHGCYEHDGNLVHIQADTMGNVSEQVLGVADQRCWLGTDANGKLHVFFTIGNVINHGTFE